MSENQSGPAVEVFDFNLEADPWAFWLLLRSRFLDVPSPAAEAQAVAGRAVDEKTAQVSFLAQRIEGQEDWPSDDHLTSVLATALGLKGWKVRLSPCYRKQTTEKDSTPQPNSNWCELNTIGTGSIIWDWNLARARENIKQGAGWPEIPLDKRIEALNSLRKEFRRLKISRPVEAQLEDALAALGIVRDRDPIDGGEPPAYGLEIAGSDTGADSGESRVVVGFVDNGCAFAHPNFIRNEGDDPYRSRVSRLWDQSCLPIRKANWTREKKFGYGWELEVRRYDIRTGEICDPETKVEDPAPQLTEDQLYEKLEYTLTENVVVDEIFGPADFTHGTHVMDIAVGAKGMAPNAEIMFVQFPASVIEENTDQASARHILDGVAYIFKHAGDRPAVVNISYNTFAGPRDGTSLLECGLDELLKTPGRAVVISAGNARNIDCHRVGTVESKDKKELLWQVNPDDDTHNFMEIWYPGCESSGECPSCTNLEISVRAPNGDFLASAVGPRKYCYLKQGGSIVGAVIHRRNDPGNRFNQVLIALNPTSGVAVANDSTMRETWSAAPAGIWKVIIHNQGNSDVRYSTNIERDNRGNSPMTTQSHFLGDQSEKESERGKYTLGGFCTGYNTIVVGAYNSATGQPMPYSSLGPTVDGRTNKPDVDAPGASDPLGDGIRAASARSGNPVRLTGTSMAAPFVTGLIALMFESAGPLWRKLDTRTIVGMLKHKAAGIRLPDGSETKIYPINPALTRDKLEKWRQENER